MSREVLVRELPTDPPTRTQSEAQTYSLSRSTGHSLWSIGQPLYSPFPELTSRPCALDYQRIVPAQRFSRDQRQSEEVPVGWLEAVFASELSWVLAMLPHWLCHTYFQLAPGRHPAARAIQAQDAPAPAFKMPAFLLLTSFCYAQPEGRNPEPPVTWKETPNFNSLSLT